MQFHHFLSKKTIQLNNLNYFNKFFYYCEKKPICILHFLNNKFKKIYKILAQYKYKTIEVKIKYKGIYNASN